MRDGAMDGSRISDWGATSQAAGGARGKSAQPLRGRQSLAPGPGRLLGPWVAAGRLGAYSRRVPVRPTRPFAAPQLVARARQSRIWTDRLTLLWSDGDRPVGLRTVRLDRASESM